MGHLAPHLRLRLHRFSHRIGHRAIILHLRVSLGSRIYPRYIPWAEVRQRGEVYRVRRCFRCCSLLGGCGQGLKLRWKRREESHAQQWEGRFHDVAFMTTHRVSMTSWSGSSTTLSSHWVCLSSYTECQFVRTCSYDVVADLSRLEPFLEGFG